MRRYGVLGTFLILIGLYLALVHFTGFATDIGAIGNAAKGVTTALQGR